MDRMYATLTISPEGVEVPEHTAIVIHPDGMVMEYFYDTFDHLREAVGNGVVVYVEHITIPNTPVENQPHVCMLVDEDGHPKKLDHNALATKIFQRYRGIPQDIVGIAVITGEPAIKSSNPDEWTKKDFTINNYNELMQGVYSVD